MKAFFKASSSARLRSLMVRFMHVRVEDEFPFLVASPIKIQRAERDDAPSPLQGGFTMEGDGQWDYVSNLLMYG